MVGEVGTVVPLLTSPASAPGDVWGGGGVMLGGVEGIFTHITVQARQLGRNQSHLQG